VHDEQHVISAAKQPTSAEPALSRVDGIFTPARLCLLLGLLMLCLFPEVILGSHAFFYRDAGLFGYPVAYYTKNAIAHGELPLWNPYSNCGIPFAAQWNTMTFYPGSVIYLAFPMPWSMNAFLLGHIFLAAIGMYQLAYRLFGSRFGATIAGLAFAWNGLSLQCIMWPCNLAALAWMPWVVLFCERAWKNAGRDFVWAALAGACQMLTGSPEFILFTWVIVFGWFVARAWAKRHWCWLDTGVLCGCVALVAFLSAVQLLPTLDLIRHGDRSSSFGDATWSMPLWGVANFLVPLFRCTPSVAGVWTQDQQQWTSSYYVGLMTLLFALIAIIKIRQLKTTLLVAVAVTGIIFSMGDAALVLKVLKSIVPLFGFIRYPIKYLALTIFALPLLAASGAAFVQTGRNRRIIVTIGMLIVAALLIVLLAQLVSSSDFRSTIIVNGTARLVFFSVAVMFLVLAATTESRRNRIASLSFLLIAMGVDICFHVPDQNPTVIVDAYNHRSPQMKSIPKLGESRAMLSLPVQVLMENSAHPNPLNMYMGQRAELFGNCNLLNCGLPSSRGYTAIPKVNGFYSLHLREQAAVNKALYDQHLPVPLAEFEGVSQVTSSEQLFSWDTFNNAMPIATVGQQPMFADDATALELVRNFNPRQTVLLPVELKSKVNAGRDADARVIEQSIGTHEHRYEVHATHPTLFVIAQTYSQNWRAFIDGSRVPLFRANVAFQAIEIPAGKHFVRLVYRDQWFYAGLAFSAIGLLACVTMLVVFRNDHIVSK
jgi:hypothetical protein